jgi:hypothetical protein
MQFLVNLAVLALLGYFLFDVATSYLAASGTVLRRLWVAFKESATIAWLRLVGIVAAGIDSLAWIADALNAPQVANAVQTYGNPRIVTQIILAVTIVGEIARRRTLSTAR